MKFRRGFSLMELIIVISILAIITTGSLAAYQLTQRNARDGRRQSDLEKVRQALELYRTDMGTYPTAGGGGWVDVSSLGVLVPDYIDQLPVDPTKPTPLSPYRYRATNLSGTNYYGYCVEADLENTTPTSNPCTPEVGYNYAVRHP